MIIGFSDLSALAVVVVVVVVSVSQTCFRVVRDQRSSASGVTTARSSSCPEKLFDLFTRRP